MCPRPKFQIKRHGPHEWRVYLLLCDGRVHVRTESTVDAALTVALNEIAARKHKPMEVTG